MADLESNIRLNVDTSDALASLKLLQGQISQFQRQMARTSAANADSARKLRQGLIDDINATGRFSASMATIRSTSETFTNALEKNKLSLGEYFRYAGASTKTFGKLFKQEYDTIGKVARERVKDLQTQYIALGRDAGGALKGLAVRPLRLDMENLGTQTAITAQRQQIFNQLLRQGSTNLLNFGKNTQWAGRQLMVGFTIPLSIFGSIASKTFMEIEEQAIRFRRVYGDAMTTASQTDEALQSMRTLASEFTKYGVEISKTVELAADAAQMGLQGADLREQVANATRLAVLGEVEQQEALKTSVALTNTFGIATANLADKINFLNIVENETMTAISDLTIAIPKAGPAVRQLGGSVEDLAFFLTAMKEGGINASEGANALKSGLASIINPTRQSVELLKLFNVNITEIRDANRGDIKGLFFDLAESLDALDPGQRAQAIEQLFGKFQFSRVSTLLQNIVREGSQAQRVLELTNSTTEELARLSDRELRRVEESTTFRFRSAVEQFQEAIAPIGEEFLKLITPLIEFGTKIVNQFNNLSDGAKQFIVGLTVLLGAVGPVAIMTFGLLANGVANILKGFASVRSIFLGVGKQSNVLGEQLDYMNSEQLQAAAVAASLDQTHSRLIQTFTSEAGAVKLLADAYRTAWKAQQQFDTGRRITTQSGFNPGTLKLASGIMSVPGPKGAGDVVPAMLSPGEAVIPADATEKYAPLIAGIIADNIPGFRKSNVTVKGPVGLGTAVGKGEAADAFAHLTKSFGMTIQQFADALTAAGKKIPAVIQKAVDAGLGDASVRAYGGLGFTTRQSFNNAMKEGGPGVIPSDFMQDYDSRGLKKWQTSLDIAGIKMEDVQDDLLLLDKEIGDQVRSAAALDDQFVVTDEVMEKFTRNALAKLQAKGSELATAFDQAEQKITEFRIMFTREHLSQKGYVQDPNNKRRMVHPETGVSFDAKQEKRANRRKGGIAKAIRDDFDDALIKEAEIQSPSKKTQRAAKGMVQGVTTGIEKGKDDAIKAGEQLAQSTVEGVTRISRKRVTTDPNAVPVGTQSGAPKRSRRSSSGGIAVLDPVTQQYVTSTQKATVATKNMADSTNIAATATKRAGINLGAMNSMLMNGTFALTSLAGAGMFMEGQIGEISNKIFQYSGILFGLMQITQLLTQAKIAELAATRLSIAKSAAFGPAIGPKTAAQAATGLGATFAKLGTFVKNLFSPIGWVILGLTALTAVVAWFIKAENDRKKALEGFANTANLAGDQLDYLANKFGVTANAVNFTQPIVPGQAADTGPTPGQLRSDEQFLKTYEDQINSLRNSSEEAARQQLEGLAMQLDAQGFAASQIQTIVTALLQESDKNSIRLDIFETNEDGTLVLDVDPAKTAQDLVKKINDAVVVATKANGSTMNSYIAGGGTTAIDSEEVNTAIANQVAYTTSALSQLRSELNSGEISAEDYQSRLAELFDPIEDLDGEVLNKTITALAESMEIDVDSITSDMDKVLAAKAAVAGVEITGEEVKVLNAGGREAYELRKKLNKEIQDQAQNIKDVTAATEAQAVIDEAVAAAKLDLVNQNTNLEDQIAAYNILIEQGYDLGDAITYATNATIAQGLATATTQEELQAMFDLINKNRELTEQANKIFNRGGAAEKSPLQLATEALKEQQTQLKNANTAYTRLRNAGLSVADAMSLAEDSTIAAGIASTKVGSAAWKNLLTLINKTNAALQQGAVKELLRSQAAEIDLLNQETLVSSALEQLGYSYEEIQNILSDNTAVRQLASDLEDGKIELVESIELLENFQTIAEQGINLNMTTKEGAANEFQKLYDQATGFLEAQKAVINVDFRLETAEDQALVTDAQNAIAAIEYEVDDLEAQLRGIEEQEQEITDTYDKRIEALEEVEKINERLAAQQKAQLTIADALSQGDIAAAAKAAQEMRQEQAAQQIDQQKEALDAAKEQALANVRSADGRSRVEIEKEIKTLKDEIFAIEENTLEPARERIRLAEVERDTKLTALDEEILKWEQLSAQVNLSKLSLTDDEMQAMKDQAQIIANMLANWDKIEDKTATLTIIKKTQDSTSTSGGGGGGGGGGNKPLNLGGNPPASLTKSVVGGTKGLLTSGPVIAQMTEGEKAGGSTKTPFLIGPNGVPMINGQYVTSGPIKKTTPTPSVNTPSVRKLLNDIGLGDSQTVSKAAPKVKFLASGGMALGSDTMPAMLTPGEFVMSRYAVQKYGVDKLKSMNSGTSGSDSVYNYNLAVNVKSDANPNEIARVVMGQIKQVESQRLRSNRF